MNSVHFNVINFIALSPSLLDHNAWQEWASNQKLWPEPLTPVPHHLIPPMMRRRMSALSKLAMQTALELTEGHNVDYIVFASRHGELTRTVKLMQDILAGEDASPIAFSQSVHNTAAGLYTIATKQAIPVTSIGACENTLHAALIESAAYLSDNPDHKVLVVDFDEPLPEPYQEFDSTELNTSAYHGYALGMILSSGDGYQLAWEAGLKNKNVQESKQQYPQTLNVIANLLSDKQEWTITAPRTLWHWKR
ncbi:beta-ketoacyl synthase chain length factor [Photobacterium profundum]|uniref:beta-ketoacyl synthase chain length factor n=1 Tax=Photobacterium profundum TaxID=74109 RepID=UPI003D09F657